MAELPPVLLSKPTLISIEAKWCSPIIDNEPTLGVPSGYPSGCTKRYVSSAIISKKLKSYIEDPIGIYDNQNRLLSFVGTKDGKEYQFFDILVLHRRSRVDSKYIEEYTNDYIRLLVLRSSLNRQFSSTKPTNVTDELRIFDEKAMREELKRKIEEERKNIEQQKGWLIKQCITYMNRYFGIVRSSGKTTIAVKVVYLKVPIEGMQMPPTTSFILTDLASFKLGHVSMDLPGDTRELATIWYKHDDCARYDGIGFGPNVDINALNYWHGFNPIPTNTNIEDANPTIEHIRDDICGGDEKLADYFIKLQARYIQQPFDKTQVQVTLEGNQGAGKSYLYDGLAAGIMGDYYLNLKVGALERFDGCLARKLHLHLEEMNNLKDPKIIAKLKSFVTSPHHSLEEKYLPRQTVPNYLNISASTNEINCAHVEHDDRRNLVIHVEGKHIAKTPENRAYWDKLWAVPPAAYHKYLLSVDLTGFDPTDIPMTKATREKKLMSLESPVKWWYGLLSDGHETFLNPGRLIPKKTIYNEYVSWSKARNERPMNDERFWPLIGRAMGTLYHVINPRTENGQIRQLVIPSLQDCKQQFKLYMKDENVFDD